MKYIVLFLLFFSHQLVAGVDLVRVDKSENRMYLLEGNTVVREYHIALGANAEGHKQREGDERTPEGDYILDFEKENSSFYRAVHISYPNDSDIDSAKREGVSPGGAIMVHGQRNGFGWLALVTQRFNWTQGCIALSNSDMDEFLALVKIGTKIHIEW